MHFCYGVGMVNLGMVQGGRKHYHFRYALQCCKTYVARYSVDSLSKKLLTKNTKALWKEIKNCYGKNNHVLASTVNNESRYSDIAKTSQ